MIYDILTSHFFVEFCIFRGVCLIVHSRKICRWFLMKSGLYWKGPVRICGLSILFGKCRSFHYWGGGIWYYCMERLHFGIIVNLASLSRDFVDYYARCWQEASVRRKVLNLTWSHVKFLNFHTNTSMRITPLSLEPHIRRTLINLSNDFCGRVIRINLAQIIFGLRLIFGPR